MQLMYFVEDLGVQVIGGCCGTPPYRQPGGTGAGAQTGGTPLPLGSRQRRGCAPEPQLRACRLIDLWRPPYHPDNSFLIIGERLNASGSGCELLAEEDWDGLVSIAWAR